MYRLTLFFLLTSWGLSAQIDQLPPHPKHYILYQTIDSVFIDGKDDEASWKLAPKISDFEDIEGPTLPTPSYPTEVKMLWDQQFLYFYIRLYDPHIWATLSERESIIYHDNDIEIFIDPNGDHHHYAELEFNAHGTVMDLLLAKPYRNSCVPSFNWDAKGMKWAVHHEGTINQADDTDKYWALEIALPLSAISDLLHQYPLPKAGDQWRLNFSRVQWDHRVVKGKYEKLKKPEHNWVWSPTWQINMHRPEYWGYLQFSPHKADQQNDQFVADEHWEEKAQLMQSYELLRAYKDQNGSYPASLEALSFPTWVKQDALHYEGITSQFTLYYQKDQVRIYTTQESKIWILKK